MAEDVSSQFIAEIRQYLRIHHNHFDNEIADLIESARADLILGGILPEKAEDRADALVKRAIVSYVKAEFGFDNPDAEKYRSSYEMIKRHLQLSNEYTVTKGA